MTTNESALVVLSGGQDSTTCLFWALREFGRVQALSFLYGQQHAREVELARQIAGQAGIPFAALDVPLIGQLGHNALTDPSLDMDSEKPEGTFPNTFVPGRNLFFLSIAAVYARERGIRHLVTGVSQTDFSGYPDCRDSFIRSLNVTLNLAMDGQFVIHTPPDVARQGTDLGAGRRAGSAGAGAPAYADLLPRHTRRRLRALPRLPPAPRGAAALPGLERRPKPTEYPPKPRLKP